LLIITVYAKYRRVPTLDEIEKVFFALSHEARRHIVLLLGHSGGELPSGYLAERFQHSWPTTTRHLKVLEEAGLVEVRRHGRSSHYKLKRDHVQRVLGGWIGMLDAPSPTKTWAPTGPRSIAQLSRATATQKGKRR
jgi:DNA-binding transcriptional ArsR family regulator